MSSAQVLPSLRKQDHLEAGKRRLEEFRKKKAADRAKKAASNSQLQTADAGIHKKQPSEGEHGRLTDSDGVGTSNGVGRAFTEPSGVAITTEFVQKDELGSYDTHGAPCSANNYNVNLTDKVHAYAEDKEFKGYDPSVFSQYVNYSHQEKENNDNFGIYPGDSRRQTVRDIDSNFSQYSYSGFDKTLPNNSDSHSKDFRVINPGTHAVDMDVSLESSGGILPHNTSVYADPLVSGQTSSSFEEYVHRTPSIGVFNFEAGRKTHGALESNNFPIPDMGAAGNLISANGPSQWPLESRATAFSFDVRSPSNHVSQSPVIDGTNTRRSRPSFLDSINVARVSSASVPHTEIEKADSKAHPMDVQAYLDSENSMNSSVATLSGVDMFRNDVNENNVERKHDFYSRKQDEDFASLEQHIEDLTQEKFSLQRTLEASRALADSLAAENSALTDSYNQQGSAVNLLKSDMESLQGEIKAQLVELESLKIQYANAQLECNAADERAKLFASEVIGLEEKALRLRSNELKLERQLEILQAEIPSFKKKMSRLEKERQDLQSTVDALLEEKKLLQSMLRKTSTSGKLVDVNKNPSNKKDMSTSTEDLVDRDDADTSRDTSNLEIHTSALLGSDTSSFSLQPGNGQFDLEGLSLTIPPDQMRMVQNINTSISELALEKEELIRALSDESSQGSKLKELNKELSRKLEAQTQRLELLTAQSMVHDNISARQLDSRISIDNTPYADEGDEVVERVLGWIMRLFPGGPSRRRTSRLL